MRRGCSLHGTLPKTLELLRGATAMPQADVSFNPALLFTVFGRTLEHMPPSWTLVPHLQTGDDRGTLKWVHSTRRCDQHAGDTR